MVKYKYFNVKMETQIDHDCWRARFDNRNEIIAAFTEEMKFSAISI